MTGCASIGGDYCISSGAVLDTPRLDETRVPEFSKHNVDVMWIRVTRAEMIAAGLRIAGTSELAGLTIPPADDNRCVVIVADDTDTRELSLALGHEVLHCYHGLWHDAPPPFGPTGILSDPDRSKKFRLTALAAVKLGFGRHFDKIADFLGVDEEEIAAKGSNYAE